MNQWFVVQTKPKKEKDVEDQLVRASFDVFLPKLRAINCQLSGINHYKPLFPSYLFIKTDFDNPQIHRMIRFTRGTTRILGDTCGPVPLADFIVETLQEKTKDGSLIEQELLFKEGNAVTVKRGILKDLQGIIEMNLSEKGRVRVLFKWLNNSMRAELKYTELERAA